MPFIITALTVTVISLIYGPWYGIGTMYSLVSSESAIGFWEHNLKCSHAFAVEINAFVFGHWIVAVFFWKEKHITLPFEEKSLTQIKTPDKRNRVAYLISQTSPYIAMGVWKLIPFIGAIVALTIYKYHKLDKTASIIIVLAANTTMILSSGYLWKFAFGRYAHQATVIVASTTAFTILFLAAKSYLQYRRIRRT